MPHLPKLDPVSLGVSMYGYGRQFHIPLGTLCPNRFSHSFSEAGGLNFLLFMMLVDSLMVSESSLTYVPAMCHPLGCGKELFLGPLTLRLSSLLALAVSGCPALIFLTSPKQDLVGLSLLRLYLCTRSMYKSYCVDYYSLVSMSPASLT